MPWLQDHNPNIDWIKEQGQTLNEITQVIDLIKNEGPLKMNNHDEITIALIDHEETWARAKELANYFKDSNLEENECTTC